MTVYRVLVYRRGLHLVATEQAGELVRSDLDWRLFVNVDGTWFDHSVAPAWHESREDAIRAAIAEVEEAAASAAVVLDELRQRLVNIEQRPLPAEVAALSGHGESAAGGRDVTPAGQDRSNGSSPDA